MLVLEFSKLCMYPDDEDEFSKLFCFEKQGQARPLSTQLLTIRCSRHKTSLAFRNLAWFVDKKFISPTLLVAMTHDAASK
jgi:hypothetical protein